MRFCRRRRPTMRYGSAVFEPRHALIRKPQAVHMMLFAEREQTLSAARLPPAARDDQTFIC